MNLAAKHPVQLVFGGLLIAEEHARTLSDVKRLLSIWSTPFRVERRTEGSVIVTERFEIRQEEGV